LATKKKGRVYLPVIDVKMHDSKLFYFDVKKISNKYFQAQQSTYTPYNERDPASNRPIPRLLLKKTSKRATYPNAAENQKSKYATVTTATQEKAVFTEKKN
jgi:hypothetical protein